MKKTIFALILLTSCKAEQTANYLSHYKSFQKETEFMNKRGWKLFQAIQFNDSMYHVILKK